MKRIIFNENNFSLVESVRYSKLVEVTEETHIFEVYSYHTLMMIVKCKTSYNHFECRVYPRSNYYSVTTAKHIRKALDEISPRLLRMFREIGNKKVIENKISFGYAIIRGESPIERIFTK